MCIRDSAKAGQRGLQADAQITQESLHKDGRGDEQMCIRDRYVSMATDYIKNAQEYYDGTATADDLGVKALDDKTLEITLICLLYTSRCV